MKTTYRDILNQVFQDRSAANPSYSMRSFARDLCVPASTLSEVLNGRKGVSPKRSIELAKRLRLPEWQTQLFCDLTAKEHAKSPRLRNEAKLRLKDRAQETRVHVLNQSALRALTSWIDLAVLEVTHLKEFKPSYGWVAKNLGVDESLISSSVKRLQEAQLLEVDKTSGTWTDVSPLFTSTDGIPNEYIRRFHRTVLQLGLKKLESSDTQSRIVKSVVFSLSANKTPQAKKILDEAIVKIVALADESGQERDDVMCFSAQLFSLLESKTGSKKGMK